MWDAGERQGWTAALAALLNLPDERLQTAGAPRTLTPPLYGRWYAAATRLDPSAPVTWFEDVNADPRTRVAAAAGWQVVQNEEQQLLAGAWAQVDAVRAANQQLRQAQLAREAALRLYARHVLTRSAPQLRVVHAAAARASARHGGFAGEAVDGARAVAAQPAAGRSADARLCAAVAAARTRRRAPGARALQDALQPFSIA